jgi:hypothetical protein
MSPTLGRVVLFRSQDGEHLGNGAQEVPAIITRVWTDTCVNVLVMRDASSPLALTSVSYAEDFEASGQWTAWRWPPRQGQVEVEAPESVGA